jgi:NAD-dependent deacetylase
MYSETTTLMSVFPQKNGTERQFRLLSNREFALTYRKFGDIVQRGAIAINRLSWRRVRVRAPVTLPKPLYRRVTYQVPLPVSMRHNSPMHLATNDRLFVLTGAGVSAESGLATFRGSGGLWNGHRVEKVATPEAWGANPELVWRFYSMRRQDALAAQPNAAHRALAAIEQKMGDRFYLCTQNVDDLHERAGSRRVHHMHGTLFQSRCESCGLLFADSASYETAASLPMCRDCGSPVRPHIVWFGEVPLDMEDIYRELERATVLLVVGTSGSVYPAAGFVHIANQRGIRTVYIGPENPGNVDAFDEVILAAATEALPETGANI